MKRLASEAFPVPGAVVPTFQPSADALFDPKAYFAQFQQQAAMYGQVPHAFGTPPVAATSSTAAQVQPDPSDKSDIHKQVEAVSAVKCASIVKEKGQNFTNAVALAALCTMATKSSFKLREELLRQPHVRKLCKRIENVIAKPPPGMSPETLISAAWSLSRFGPGGMESAKASLDGAAQMVTKAAASSWHADSASKMLWSLAKADIITQYKPLVSQIVGELVRDLGRRVAELSHEGLINLLWAVARARRHVRQGDHTTVHTEANDGLLFEIAAKRVKEEVERIDVKLLADLIHTHAEVGIRDEPLFRAICPQILAKQKELREDAMGRVIKAYTRFMIPLRETPQGFRTMAVVQKGDFIRPSEKPPKKGNTYDHPQPLYEKTQLHARG